MADNQNVDITPFLERLENNRANKIPTAVRFDRIPEEYHQTVIDQLSDGYPAEFRQMLTEASKQRRPKNIRFDRMPSRKETWEEIHNPCCTSRKV